MVNHTIPSACKNIDSSAMICQNTWKMRTSKTRLKKLLSDASDDQTCELLEHARFLKKI
jgi:hypothetical protein